MRTRPWARGILAAALPAVLALAAPAQTPPETFDEKLVVRETSVVALPPGSGANLPTASQVEVAIDGEAQRVTRIERMLEGQRGDWHLVVYLDPRLAGPRTRFLTTLALGQRAESLTAMGTVEVLEADRARPLLASTGSWQRIEAALLSHALEAKHRLARGDAPAERPDWSLFEDRIDLMLETLERRGASGPRALFLPSDGLYASAAAEELAAIARRLAGDGWVVVALPWNERPSESSAARLSEFESWKESAEGRDGSASTRRYVIDFGKVFRHLSGDGESPRGERPAVEAHVVALQSLAAPTSGLVAARDAELNAALSNLARRWRIWFQTAAGDGGARPLTVRLGEARLAAPGWVRLPRAE